MHISNHRVLIFPPTLVPTFLWGRHVSSFSAFTLCFFSLLGTVVCNIFAKGIITLSAFNTQFLSSESHHLQLYFGDRWFSVLNSVFWATQPEFIDLGNLEEEKPQLTFLSKESEIGNQFSELPGDHSNHRADIRAIRKGQWPQWFIFPQEVSAVFFSQSSSGVLLNSFYFSSLVLWLAGQLLNWNDTIPTSAMFDPHIHIVYSKSWLTGGQLNGQVQGSD